MNKSRSPSPSDRQLDLKIAELNTQLISLQKTIHDQKEKSISDDEEISRMKTNLARVLEAYREVLKPEAYQEILKKLEWFVTSNICHQ